MSGKSEKKIRRRMKKFNEKVFQDFVIEISIMPAWERFKFCANIFLLRHGLQKHLKDNIVERRKYNPDGTLIEKKRGFIMRADDWLRNKIFKRSRA